ncbi:MAG: hypothetical protein J6V72_14150 [Kiritimatiellae bacterium]|nr:hypothetical protein [Kiritimatiellia bacterium]
MTGRSTSTPKIAVGAGLLAAALGSFTVDGTASSNGASMTDLAQSTTPWEGVGNPSTKDVQVVKSTLSFPIDEEWSDERHMAELRSLVVKKATSKSGFSAKDAKRLEVLQRMRRESLPLAMSYDEFIRERERNAQLMRLTDALLEYERKYGKKAQA